MKRVVTALAAGFLLYFAGAFGNWEFNPGNWSDLSRGLVAVGIPMLMAFTYFAPDFG